ncbi:hypothetical protein [Brevundimonas sp. NIBR11]|uniref:hypothetical protein n=1 Tax=Brevundimonas sp. NIBR11 TaxID=3015999 RepID=UPI0022F06E50|nr:hypothetical protein [Brevundimonas sp. NIBR11]WGM31002.1 hypothetical protein KKHFBJBL_01236 [Brevundimonas sp. NIBR11]
MLALVFALALSTDIPQQTLPDPRGQAVDDVEITGSDLQVFCVRSQQINSSRIRRPSACRTQGEWRVLARARDEDRFALMVYRGTLSMDSSLLEEGVTRAELIALRAEARSQGAAR